LGSSWLGPLAGPDDLVIVFISTNAFPATDDTTYLCAYDCALDNVYATCISMQNLMDTLKKYVTSHRILLIVQSAYSGAAQLSGAKALFNGYNIDVDKVALGKGYIILSSSQPDQITWGDSFSKNLIAALRLQDGLINLEDAFAIARRKTEAETDAKGKKQTPTMKSDWNGNNLVVGAPQIEQVSAIPPTVASFVAAESHYLRANNALIKGDKETAASEYQAAIADDGKYADAICDYGALEFMNEKFAHAAQLYETAALIHPDDELIHANYARVLAELGNAGKAKTELQTAYRLNPKDINVLAALASQYAKDGDLAQAQELLKMAMQLAPNSDSLHQRLSYIYSKSGNNEAALHEAQEAARLNPKSVSAWLNLGSLQLMSGKKDQAILNYKQALQLEPNNADAHYFLSKLFEAAGDFKRASFELTTFLQCCRTDDPRGLTAQQHFKELAAHQQ
jgi:tetratricopeptide (TPR) repeat protein